MEHYKMGVKETGLYGA